MALTNKYNCEGSVIIGDSDDDLFAAMSEVYVNKSKSFGERKKESFEDGDNQVS